MEEVRNACKEAVRKPNVKRFHGERESWRSI